MPEGAFEDPAALVGRGLIDSVVRHEPILPGKLASKEAGSGLPPIIPAGKRAMSVRVNEVIGVAGYVLPGTHVDIVATQSPTAKAEDMTSKVVLSNVEVLTAGTRLEHDSKDGKPISVTVVTLVVTPDEAERLTLASTEGKIQLALRNPLDVDSPATAGVKPGILMGTVQQRTRGPGRAALGAGEHVSTGIHSARANCRNHPRRQAAKRHRRIGADDENPSKTRDFRSHGDAAGIQLEPRVCRGRDQHCRRY